MGIIEDFIEKVKLREGFRFDKEVADLIGVDRHSLANAKLRGKLPNTYTKWYCKNYNIPLDRFYEDIKITNTAGGSKLMDAQTLIDNQEKLIKYQEKEILDLKKENQELINNPIQKESFDLLNYDWKTTVELKWGLQVQRRIYDLENISLLANSLGVTEKEIEQYFDTANYYPMKEHPINKIITKQSLQGLQKKTGWFMDLVRKGKDLQTLLQGMSYLTFLVDYELNEKKCRTLSHCLIIQRVPSIKIVNKIQILKD